MLTPLALALHEVRQLLSTARETVSRAVLRGKAGTRQAGRVEAFEESEAILETAMTTQREADVVRSIWSVRRTIAGLRHKGKGEPSERVVVPFESEGSLRSLREDRDADEGSFTPKPGL